MVSTRDRLARRPVFYIFSKYQPPQPYFLFLQNTVFYIFTKYRSASQRLQNIFSRPSDRRPLPAARQTDQPAQPAQPTRPAQPRSLLLTLFCIFAKYPWPASPDRPPNWVFIIFTKYRILHFYKIPLHRPADRGQLPLRTQTQPASQTSQPSRPSQPGRPSQPSIVLAHSILYFRKISLACQSRQAASLDIFYFSKIPYFPFLQNTVFYIFTKYRLSLIHI